MVGVLPVPAGPTTSTSSVVAGDRVGGGRWRIVTWSDGLERWSGSGPSPGGRVSWSRTAGVVRRRSVTCSVTGRPSRRSRARRLRARVRARRTVCSASRRAGRSGRPARRRLRAASAGRRVAMWRARSARSQVDDSSADAAERLGDHVLVAPPTAAIAGLRQVGRRGGVSRSSPALRRSWPRSLCSAAGLGPGTFPGTRADGGSAFEPGDRARVGVGAVVFGRSTGRSARRASPRPGRTAARTRPGPCGDAGQVDRARRRGVPSRRRGGAVSSARRAAS